MNTRKLNSELSDTHIAPWLSVSKAAEAVDFYKAALGAIEINRLEEDDGKLVVAQLSVNGADFWIQEDPDSSPEPGGRGSVRMILSVQDPDSMFDQAVSAGATVIFPVGEAHGWRIGRLFDPFGHHWEIGKRLG